MGQVITLRQIDTLHLWLAGDLILGFMQVIDYLVIYFHFIYQFSYTRRFSQLRMATDIRQKDCCKNGTDYN